MALTEKELLAKKKEIEKAKQELAELKGEEKALLKTLKEEYGVSSLEEARELLATKKEEVAELQEDLDNQLEEIEQKYF